MGIAGRSFFFPLMVVLSFATFSSAGQFKPALNYFVGSQAAAVAIGDFNNDGKLDIVSANQASAVGIGVLLGNGDGTFNKVIHDTFGLMPVSLAVGDFNKDGKLDVAVADSKENVVYTLLGNGDGTFQAPIAHLAGTIPVFVATADVNGDGNVDLVVASNGDVGPFNGGVAVRLGNGDGTFQPFALYAAGAVPGSLAVGDVNGDGIADIVATNLTPSLGILLGNGDGSFKKPTAYSLPFAATSLALGDFNGDGKQDVTAVLPPTGLPNAEAILGLGNGDGTFSAPTKIGSGIGFDSIVAGDFTFQGFLDVAISRSGTPLSKAVLYSGNGNGTFSSAQQSSTGSQSVGIASGDLNGDGSPDLVLVNRASGTVSVLINAGNSGYRKAGSSPKE